MSVPDHQLNPDEEDAVWCAICLKLHGKRCECWDDIYTQNKFDEMRESNP